MPGSPSRRRITAAPPAGMTRGSAETRRKQDELASELRHIAEEIRPLTDSVDSLYILLQHVWQNRDALFELVNGFSERTPVRCERCSSSPTLTEAVTNGWKDLRNEEGMFWGLCPPCHETIEDDRDMLPPETLFCTCCDATSATSLAEALRAGWQCIVDDEGNERGNYAGMCPGCIDEEQSVAEVGAKDAEDPALDTPHGQKTLF